MTEGIRSSWKIAVPATKIMLMPKSRFRKKSACLIWLDFFPEFKFSGTSEAAVSGLVSVFMLSVLSLLSFGTPLFRIDIWIVFSCCQQFNFRMKTVNRVPAQNQLELFWPNEKYSCNLLWSRKHQTPAKTRVLYPATHPANCRSENPQQQTIPVPNP